MAIPTHVITGALGVGKTTAIVNAFEHRRPGERWAVLVNEFGEIGIDGALLAAGDGYAVREVPGGCICCTAGPQLQLALARLIEDVRPHRLFIEPTGLAEPASIVDLVRRPWFGELELHAVITLVDPRACLVPEERRPAAWWAQLEVADVLVANKTDLAGPAALEAFDAVAGGLWPAKAIIARTVQGRLDPAWLAAGRIDRRGSFTVPREAHELTAISHGRVYGVDEVFDAHALRAALQDLAVPGPFINQGILRLKGVFRTNRAWVSVQCDGEQMQFAPTAHRADSRVEWIVPEGEVDWDAVDARLAEALIVTAASGDDRGPPG